MMLCKTARSTVKSDAVDRAVGAVGESVGTVASAAFCGYSMVAASTG